MKHDTQTRLGALAAAIALLPAQPIWSQAAAPADGVRAGYSRPTLAIPFTRTPPTIDAVVGADEWRGAVSVNALQTTSRQVSLRQTRFFFLWDADNLYIAMRSPLREGERLVRAIRGIPRDVNVVYDDSYEIWLNAGTEDPATGLDCFFQFLCNFDGSRYDAMHLPSVGNSRLGWTSGWSPTNRIARSRNGRAWEWELAIPRADLGLTAPLHDGQTLTCLVARNFKRPWEQNSFEGTSDFSVSDTHTLLRLAADCPALHLDSVGVSEPPSFGIRLRAASPSSSPMPLRWRFASDAGIDTQKTGTAPAGDPAILVDTPALDVPKADDGDPGYFRITVSSPDGRTTWLDWCAKRQFGLRDDMQQTLSDSNMRIDLRPLFNPVRNYLRVVGDFIDYAARDQIKTVSVTVRDAAKETIAQRDLTIDAHAYVSTVFQLPDLAPGQYSVKMLSLDDTGAMLENTFAFFEKKNHADSFPWWNTPHGNIERVIAPWTPVTCKDGRFGVWGRTMQLGVAGLPARITTQGRDMLAAPVRLVGRDADGQPLEAVPDSAAPSVVSAADHRAVMRANAALGSLSIDADVSVEFDGMYKIALHVTPPAAASVPLQSMAVVIPLASPFSDYLHAAGEGIRTGFDYRSLPRDTTGTVWTCRSVDGQPMVVGSFIPYVWVGSPLGGLAWYADSDEGWAPNPATPAIEVRRRADGGADLVLNLVSSPLAIDAPRTIVFALQASPVKPMHKRWRMDTWWCGDTFKDYSFAGHIIWAAVPFTKDTERCRQLVENIHTLGSTKYIFGFEDKAYRPNAVPYFIHQNLPEHLVPEMSYFNEHWRTSISECLCYNKSLTDYMAHNYGEWARTTGIDGYYVDNVRPVACDNIEAGRGYRLPDGRIQPTYQMFDTRRYFLRIRAAFAEQGRTNKIVLHVTNNMILPWIGAADIAYDGEHHVIYPRMNKDFMDFWSLERMQVDYPAQWGTAVNFMQEYQGEYAPAQLAKVMRAFTGMVILFDALPSGNCNGWNQPVWIGRHRFGIDADDVRFLGYWDAAPAITCTPPDVKTAAWLRPGKMLLAAVNLGDATDAHITLQPQALGLPPANRWTLRDAETNTTTVIYHGPSQQNVTGWNADDQAPPRHDGKGTLTIPVARHDYRQIIIEAP